MRESHCRAFLDRIEGDIAVLLLGDEEQNKVMLPARYLPKDTREGVVLTCSFRVEEEETESARSRVQSLIDELTG
ncbi:MAG: DUF3006 domain-containing protein [Armatimonadetes bacterium]|nr:DUF3006 domain-containing protein [Armatimonadota bacterium]